MARVFNLTPHALQIFSDGPEPVVVIPSDGALRLLAMRPQYDPWWCEPEDFPVDYVCPERLERISIPTARARVVTGLDEKSPGYKHYLTLRDRDRVIVTLPVAQWLATHTDHQFWVIYSPDTGPLSGVRFEDGERKGQVKGVKALEYHSRVQ